LRWNSKTVPWIWFVPDRVMALMTPPDVRPYSAE
jgi:hypothetical protein